MRLALEEKSTRAFRLGALRLSTLLPTLHLQTKDETSSSRYNRSAYWETRKLTCCCSCFQQRLEASTTISESNGIPLMNPSRAPKKIRCGTINQNGKSNSWNTTHYPLSPFFWESTSLRHIHVKSPIHMIMCSFYIQLAQHPWNPCLRSIINTFRSY